MRRRDFIPVAAAFAQTKTSPANEWRHYGGDANASRYSPLARLNKTNAAKLKPVWSHHTGDAQQRPATAIECTPIVVDGTMYLNSAMLKVHAINPATGERKWAWDPFNGRSPGRSPGNNRGVTYFQQGKEKRILTVVQDRLYSIDAVSGELDNMFGEKGAVDLKNKLLAFEFNGTVLTGRTAASEDGCCCRQAHGWRYVVLRHRPNLHSHEVRIIIRIGDHDMPTFTGSITTTGKSEAIRLDKALFKLHPEFRQKAKVRVQVLSPGHALIAVVDDEAVPVEENDPLLGAFLGFIDQDMKAHPSRTASLSKADVAAAIRLTKKVKVDDADRLPDDVTF